MKERIEKLSQIWTGLPAGRKVSLIVAIAGVVVLSGLILSLSGGNSSMRVLVSGAEAADLGEVVEVLDSKQVPYEYGAQGTSILVSEEHLASMRMELAMKGLPKSGDVGYEIFDEGNFGISDFVQRTNHTRAFQG